MVFRTALWPCPSALVIFLVNIIANAEITPSDRRLYFSLMLSSAAGLNTSGVVPAVEKELQVINIDPTILPGYSLHYTRVADTKVKVYMYINSQANEKLCEECRFPSHI